MTDRDQYDCLRCDRTFLSKAALDRHYDRNPDHAEKFVIDADAIESDATILPGGKWLETDETVETFITVAAPTSSGEGCAAGAESAAAATESGAGVEMTFDPEAASLVVHGIRDREIDLSQFWDAVGDTLTWSFDGTYLKIQFYKNHER